MKKYLILLAAAALAWSCGDDKNVDDQPKPEPPAEEAFISLSITEYAFAQAGGTSDEITVTSSGEWELIGDDKVFVASAVSGSDGDKVTFTAEANTKSEPRTETFRFLCDGEIAELTLTQAAGDELTIETLEYAAQVKGGSIYVEVKASGAYEYTVEEGAAWLTKPTAATTAAATPSRAELVVAANDTGKSRRATVTFTLGELSVPVVVTQAQNDVLEVAEGAELTYETGKPAETVTFGFKANFKPTVTASAEWISVGEPVAASTEEGVVAYTLSIEVAANDGAPREGTVTIAHAENSEVEPLEIAVKQDGEEPLPDGAVRIPDANFRKALLKMNYIESADKEVCMLTQTGKGATEMNVSKNNLANLVGSGTEITDLTGIEAFVNLTNLQVWGNAGITRLDLSKNPKITTLNVNLLTKLTYLNLGTMSLQWLDVKNLVVTSLKIVYEGTMSDELGITGSMTTLDMSECTGSIKYLNLANTTTDPTTSNKLSGTLDLHTIKGLQKLNLNGCKSLTKVILPKDVESSIQILSQPELVEIEYK